MMVKARWQDQSAAMRTRDSIKSIIRSQIERMRPDARVGVVTEFNPDDFSVHVLFPGNDEDVEATCSYDTVPGAVGDYVRVAGRADNLHVTDVLSADPYFKKYLNRVRPRARYFMFTDSIKDVPGTTFTAIPWDDIFSNFDEVQFSGLFEWSGFPSSTITITETATYQLHGQIFWREETASLINRTGIIRRNGADLYVSAPLAHQGSSNYLQNINLGGTVGLNAGDTLTLGGYTPQGAGARILGLDVAGSNGTFFQITQVGS